jgi:hypothetical protein
MDGRNPTPVDRWFIPFFIGLQHVSTILLVVQDIFHSMFNLTPTLVELQTHNFVISGFHSSFST